MNNQRTIVTLTAMFMGFALLMTALFPLYMQWLDNLEMARAARIHETLTKYPLYLDYLRATR